MDYCEDINVTFEFGNVDLKSFILNITEDYCINKIKTLKKEHHSEDLQNEKKDL